MSEQQDEIVNKVAKSSLITLDLEEYYDTRERVLLDVKDWLYQEMILKEKDFREQAKDYDWSRYEDKNVAITCTVDAIVPTWAYMLLASKLSSYAHRVVFGDLEALEQTLFQDALKQIDPEDYKDAKIVIKGCGHYPVPVFAYVELTQLLRPYVSSIMYGEPCSTVPVYKKPRQKR